MVYFGINQSVIYEQPPKGFLKHRENSHVNFSREKYVGSPLSEQQIDELLKTILNYLKINKAYLNPDYNLQMMADDLNISKHKLSQIINSGQRKNFYKFINEFRIEEVKEKLTDSSYKHYSILGIAMECGFNSKTSFNRIFKEETGLTPTEFMKAL
jgi:AraC-like DNA-binding protein